MLKSLIRALFPVIVLVTAVRIAWSWGASGHSFINMNATKHLPAGMQMFINQAELLARHASDADLRKSSDSSEAPKHFLDIDSYPEFSSGTLTHDLDSLRTEYGDSTVTAHGLLPWVTKWATDSLTVQMTRGDWNKAYLTAADLGHYVGDGHQPLHATLNFDPGGLHSRYESTLIDRNLSSLTITPDSVTFISSPVDYAFGYITRSQSLVSALVQADSLAQVSAAGNTTSDLYYDALWMYAEDFTKDQFQRATVAFANLLYSAWINAGSPRVSPAQVPEEKETVPKEFVLEQNYPNPFNPTTSITYHLPASTHVSLKVLNVLGYELATLVDRYQSAGTHQVTFDASGLPSGIYFYQIRADNYLETRRMVLIK